MTAFVDVTYRGLRVAHKAKMTPADPGVFVEHETPLPVGSPLVIFEDGQPERFGHVVHVVEHEAGAGPAGMKIAWGAADLTRPVAVVAASAVAAVAEPSAAEPAAAEPSARATSEPEPEPEPDAAPDASGSMEATGSPDASGDGEGDGAADKSSDGNGVPGASKKQKKGKKRR